MKAIFLKELRSYFSNITGYLVIGIYLVVNALFLFVFNNEFNILDYGFADLTPFFLLSPWLLLFLIPATSMRSFSHESSLGTLEMLLTSPNTVTQIILAKYLAVVALLLIAIFPTLLYVISIGMLGETPFNIDIGNLIGSYCGLILLGMVYTAISIFSSCVTQNQVVAFLLAVVLCFVMYYGGTAISELSSQLSWIDQLGMQYHYDSMARGVIDTRDVVYFVSIGTFYIYLSHLSLTYLKAK